MQASWESSSCRTCEVSNALQMVPLRGGMTVGELQLGRPRPFSIGVSDYEASICRYKVR